jgi:hypothetical protein
MPAYAPTDEEREIVETAAMRPIPADLMRMWPISTRVNTPENDDSSTVEPIQPSTDAA